MYVYVCVGDPLTNVTMNNELMLKCSNQTSKGLVPSVSLNHGLSQYLETGCPNRGFIDFCVSKVWYKVHTANEINPIYLQILLL